MTNKGKREKKYTLLKDDDLIKNNKMPQSTGEYSDDGITYWDRNNILYQIPKEDIPTFLSDLRQAHRPWKQWFYWQMFYHDHKSMTGINHFKTQLTTFSQLDFFLINLAARAAAIQIATVGEDTAQPMCPRSERLLKIYDDLNTDLTNLKKDIEKIKDQTRSRHSNHRMTSVFSTFKATWTNKISHAIYEYENDWDTRNILLNMLAVISVIGLFALFVKNILRKTRDEPLELFQFELAHSRQVELLKETQEYNFFKPFNTVRANDSQPYFTDNIQDDYDTVKELKSDVNTLLIYISDKKKLHPHLLKLEQSLTDFEKAIKASKSLEDRRNAEAALMSAWCKTIQAMKIRTDAPSMSRFKLEASNILMRLPGIAEQFEKELEARTEQTNTSSLKPSF